jgi:CHAT domain-containing protein
LSRTVFLGAAGCFQGRPGKVLMADWAKSGWFWASTRNQGVRLLLVLAIAPMASSAQSTPRTNREAGLKLAAAVLALDSNDRASAEALLRTNISLDTYAFRAKMASEADRERSLGNFPRALFLYEVATLASTLCNDEQTLAACLYGAGAIYAKTGDQDRAESSYVESGRISYGRNLASLYLADLSALAGIYMGRGEYEKAKEISEDRIRYSVSLNSDYGIAPLDGRVGALATLADISEFEGDHDGAIAALRDSLEIAQTLGEKGPDWGSVVADQWLHMGWVYYRMGDYGAAVDSYSRALESSKTLGYEHGLYIAILSLAVVYLNQADYLKAEQLSHQGLEIAKELNDKETAAGALSDLGYAYQRRADYSRAEHCFTEALSWMGAQPEASETTISILEGLGTVYQGKGQYDAALNYYSEALRYADRAHKKTEQFEMIWRKADTYLAMADYDKVVELCDMAVKIAGEMAQPNFSYLVLTSRGEAYLAKGEYALAARDLSGAIDKAELMRGRIGGRDVERASFLEKRLRPYQLMVDLLIAQDKPKEALAYSERGKGRVLLDVLSSGKDIIASVMTPAQRQRDQELSAEVAALNKEIAARKQGKQTGAAGLAETESRLEKARFEYESFTDGLYAAHPEVRTQRIEPRKFDLAQLGRIGATPDTAAVEFVVTDQKTHAFVVSWNGAGAKNETSAPRVSAYDVNVTNKDLTELVDSYAERLGNPHIAKEAMARHIYDLLLAPAKDLLAGKSTIVIVPDGALWNLPFQALKQADGRYLVESYSIFYAASLTVLAEMVQKSKGSPGTSGSSAVASENTKPLGALLAFGNPALSGQVVDRVKSVHRDEKLLPLPDAEDEVRGIGALYKGPGTTIYTGAEAREDRAKAEMGHYRILHFATHGVLDSTSPMYSNIVLSTDDKSPDDGLLEAWEIMRLDLKADLAVLSACDTARGKTAGGEGVIGMSWAFFVAGCPTTVVSQWKIDSASTAQLMIEFHKNLVANAPGTQPAWKKADALRRAMLTLMARPEYKDPYYWAGFVVVGAG